VRAKGGRRTIQSQINGPLEVPHRHAHSSVLRPVLFFAAGHAVYIDNVSVSRIDTKPRPCRNLAFLWNSHHQNIDDYPPAHFHADMAATRRWSALTTVKSGVATCRAGRRGWSKNGRTCIAPNLRKTGRERVHRERCCESRRCDGHEISEQSQSVLVARRLSRSRNIRDGHTGEVDLWPLFAQSPWATGEPFSDPGFFPKGFLDEGTLAWPNGYDICSDVLRYYCDQGCVTADEEMNAYFTEETAASVLHDKPKP